MLLAMSVFGGLAMPNNPDAPSYAVGNWGLYFPVQKVHAPKNTAEDVNTEFVLPDSMLRSGNLEEFTIADRRLLYTDVKTYASCFDYQTNKNTTRWSNVRLRVDSTGGLYFGMHNTIEHQEIVNIVRYSSPTSVILNASNGTAVVGGTQTRYGGRLEGTNSFLAYVRVRSRYYSMDFYYHHASKGDWRCDIMALQTADSHSAAIDLATRQFIAIA